MIVYKITYGLRIRTVTTFSFALHNFRLIIIRRMLACQCLCLSLVPFIFAQGLTVIIQAGNQ